MNANEELLLKWEGHRKSALADAKRAADRIAMAVADAHGLAGLKALDGGELRRQVDVLLERQQRVIAADINVRRYGREALEN